jgi:bacteriocin-like protein
METIFTELTDDQLELVTGGDCGLPCQPLEPIDPPSPSDPTSFLSQLLPSQLASPLQTLIKGFLAKATGSV